MLVLGIDPGASGALAWWDTTRSELLVRDMPVLTLAARRQGKTSGKRRHIADTELASLLDDVWRPDIAWLEEVHAMPRQGVTSTFSFGVAYGVVRGVLAALRVPYHVVTPNEWKRALRLGADKSRARLVAARLFPASADLFARMKDDGRAEAALLAYFGASQGNLPLAC